MVAGAVSVPLISPQIDLKSIKGTARTGSQVLKRPVPSRFVNILTTEGPPREGKMLRGNGSSPRMVLGK